MLSRWALNEDLIKDGRWMTAPGTSLEEARGMLRGPSANETANQSLQRGAMTWVTDRHDEKQRVSQGIQGPGQRLRSLR